MGQIRVGWGRNRSDKSFTFLGSIIEKEGKCELEIRRRVAIGKAAMIGLEKIWRDKHVSIDTKKKTSEGIDLPYCTIWLRDVDNDKEPEEDQCL